MKRLIALLPALCLALAVTPVTAVAEEANASATEGVATTATEATAPQDNIVTTQHSAQIGGKKLSYTAEAGTMALETSGQSCEVFYFTRPICLTA